MLVTCPECHSEHENAVVRCACGLLLTSSASAADDPDAVLPHEGAETPPWESETKRRKERRRKTGGQTQFILSLVIPPASLATLSCCCCFPSPLVFIAIATAVGCALYWTCAQATDRGRWVYFAVTVLVWLAIAALVTAYLAYRP